MPVLFAKLSRAVRKMPIDSAMRHAWRSPKIVCSRCAIMIGVMALLYLLVAGASQAYIRLALLPKFEQTAAEFEKFRPKVIADLKQLSTNPVYPDRKRTNNAERFLSGFISWKGVGVDRIATPEHEALIRLMGRYQQAVESDSAWSTFVNDPGLRDLDLTWLDQLAGYDHLDLGTHPAYQHQLALVTRLSGAERVILSTQLPMMEENELRFAALARVAQLSRKSPRDGALIYRHVGELLASSDSLIGVILATRMLQNEKLLLKSGAIEIEPVDDFRIQAMERTAWAWAGVFKVLGLRGSLEEFEPYFKRSTNACAVATESLGYTTLMHDYFEPQVFGEFDFREPIERSQALRKRLLSYCEHDDLRVFFEPIGRRGLFNYRGRMNPERIPFSRRIWALGLEAKSQANDFRLYEENPREPASSQ